jgi:hypothetical protein
MSDAKLKRYATLMRYAFSLSVAPTAFAGARLNQASDAITAAHKETTNRV